MQKILSVSVAAYNIEKYIRQALEPFCGKGISEKVEVLIIDDGSRDSTYDIASKYEQAYPDTFKVIHKENGGWGSTVNTGIALATGKYFKVLDGDDFLSPECLSNYLEILEQIDADCVVTPVFKFNDKTGEMVKLSSISEKYERNKIHPIEKINGVFQLHNSAFKTSILKANNIHITENCFYTDNELLVKALIYLKTIYIMDYDIYHYRLERLGQSMSIEGQRKHYKETLIVAYEMLEQYNTVKESCSAREIIFNIIFSCVKTEYHLLALLKKTDELKAFDQNIKNRYPDFYSTGSKLINLLRLTRFKIVPVVSVYERHKSK